MAITPINDKVQSNLLAVYLQDSNTETQYDRVGSNCESLSINLNTETTEYADVTMATKQTDISAYKTTVEGTGKFQSGDPVYDLFLSLWRDNKTGNSARKDMIIAYRFREDSSVAGKCDADLYEGTSVSLTSFELTGADLMEVSFQLAANTTAIKGTIVCNSADNYKTASSWTPGASA